MPVAAISSNTGSRHNISHFNPQKKYIKPGSNEFGQQFLCITIFLHKLYFYNCLKIFT